MSQADQQTSQGDARHPTPPTALSLLESLGDTDIPVKVARRGLRHLTGQRETLAGFYFTHVTPPAAAQSGPGPSGTGSSDLLLITSVHPHDHPPNQDTQDALRAALLSVQAQAQGHSLDGRFGRLHIASVQSKHGEGGLLAVLDTNPAQDAAKWGLAELLAILAQQVGKAKQHQSQVQTLTRTREQMFRVLGRVLEYRSYETKGHTDRVTSLSLRLALTLDLNYEDLAHLRWGAYLHDIGKIAIADAVLHKRGPLNSQERDWMHQHVIVGEAMLREQGLVPEEVLQVVRHHHERWDGQGYPDRLSGEEIPLLARLFAVVDIYDALTSERPYKPSWSRHDTLRELRRMAGTHLDPQLVARFETMLLHTAEPLRPAHELLEFQEESAD